MPLIPLHLGGMEPLGTLVERLDSLSKGPLPPGGLPKGTSSSFYVGFAARGYCRIGFFRTCDAKFGPKSQCAGCRQATK